MDKASRDISKSLLSVVVPVYNEQGNLGQLHRELLQVVESLGCDYEIIMVDDGSTDGSLSVMQELADADEHVGIISFTRNFGHENATTAGLDFAHGDAVVIIDADLQDPPEVIEEMAERWEDGYDVVYGRRHRRSGEPAFKRMTSFLFYRLIRRISEVDIPVDAGDFRLMDRSIVELFRQLREKNQFVRAEIAWLGGKTTHVLYDRRARLSGKTKYNSWRRIKLSVDGICSFSTLPLHVMSVLGVTIFLLSLIGGLAVLFLAIFSGISIPGYVLLAVGFFFLLGCQLMFVGLLGEYLGRVYVEAKDRPLYLISSIGGFEARKGDEKILPWDARARRETGRLL